MNVSLTNNLPVEFRAESWYEKSIKGIQAAENKIDNVVRGVLASATASLALQFDQALAFIKRRFADLEQFNTWLDDTGNGKWYWRLATFLYKLPMCTVRDIIVLLHQIIKTCLAPHHIPTRVAIMLIALVSEFAKPETWAHMGAGTVGCCLGQSVFGNPFALVGFGIGVAMMIGGASLGALKSALQTERGSSFPQYMQSEIQKLASSLLKGFMMGLVIGGIEKACRVKQQKLWEKQKETFIPTQDEAAKFAEQFCAEHALPPPASVTVENNSIKITCWDVDYWPESWWHERFPQHSESAFEFVRKKFPDFTTKVSDDERLRYLIQNVQLELKRSQATVSVTIDTLKHKWFYADDYSYSGNWDCWSAKVHQDVHTFPLSDIKEHHGLTFPLPPKPYEKELLAFNTYSKFLAVPVAIDHRN